MWILFSALAFAQDPCPGATVDTCQLSCPAGASQVRRDSSSNQPELFCARPDGVLHGPTAGWYLPDGTKFWSYKWEGVAHGQVGKVGRDGALLMDCQFDHGKMVSYAGAEGWMWCMTDRMEVVRVP